MNIHYLPLRVFHKDIDILSIMRLNKRTDLDELQNSIELDGLLNPILVVRSGNSYQVVDGKKRLKVIRKLSKNSRYERRYSKVPCLINDGDIPDITIPTNKPLLLNDQELAHNIIKASHGQSSLSIIAKRYGCDLTVALKCLNLKNLHREIFKLFTKGTLSLDQAAALSTLSSKTKQLDILLKLGPSARISKIMTAVCAQSNYVSSAVRSYEPLYDSDNQITENLLAA